MIYKGPIEIYNLRYELWSEYGEFLFCACECYGENCEGNGWYVWVCTSIWAVYCVHQQKKIAQETQQQKQKQ